MAVQMLGEILAVAAAPRTVGALLTAALPGAQGEGTDWRKGTITWPEAVPGWEVLADCDLHRVDHGLGDNSDPYGAVPFLIRTLTRCPRTTLGIMADRARRQIAAITSTAVARELWTGTLSTAAPWTLPDGVRVTLANPRGTGWAGPTGPWRNPHLVAGDLLDGVAHPAAAVAAVEAAAGQRIAGGPLYIHVPVDSLLELTQFGIRPDGNVLRTPLGSVLVADPGYPGTTAPNGSPAVYGTGPVQVWLDEARVLDDPAQIVSYENNEVGVWAERLALASFDPQTLVGCPITG